jgi:formylglycine-generating enzyme required for sulfatase activity
MGMRQSLLLALSCLFLPVSGFCQPGAPLEEPKVATRLGAPSPPPAPPSPPQRSGDGAEMVSVPAGEFWMGSEESDAYAAEMPRRRVYLPFGSTNTK